MFNFYFQSILALILFSAFTAACGGYGKNTINSSVSISTNRANEMANAAKTNVEELGVLVNIPYEAVDIVWKEDSVRKRLIAVLRFSSADAAKLVAASESLRPPQAVNLSSESWFPAELIAQSDLSGDGTLNGKSYAANTFLQEPYNAGSITRIENSDYFVLEAHAK